LLDGLHRYSEIEDEEELEKEVENLYGSENGDSDGADDENPGSKRRKRNTDGNGTTILLPPDEITEPLGAVAPPLKAEILEHLENLTAESKKIHRMYYKIIGTLRRPLSRSLMGCVSDLQTFHHEGKVPRRTEDYEPMAIPFSGLLFIIEKVVAVVKEANAVTAHKYKSRILVMEKQLGRILILLHKIAKKIRDSLYSKQYVA